MDKWEIRRCADKLGVINNSLKILKWDRVLDNVLVGESIFFVFIWVF